MKAILRSGFLALAIMASAVPANAGPLEDGMAAITRGDYATALRLLRPLAERGDAWAQDSLGSMYHNGWGVSQDYAEAVTLYRKAAEQGNPAAQYSLGLIYAKGEGVPQDIVLAHMWFELAAEQVGDKLPEAKYNRDLAARQMTPNQIAEARRMAREWTAKDGRQPPASAKLPAAADQAYKRQIRPHFNAYRECAIRHFRAIGRLAESKNKQFKDVEATVVQPCGKHIEAARSVMSPYLTDRRAQNQVITAEYNAIVTSLEAVFNLEKRLVQSSKDQVPAIGQDMCSKPKAEVHASADCVRWYSVCCMKVKLGKPTELAASISLKNRYKLLAEFCYSDAEEECRVFDYVQANAALDSRLREIDRIFP